MTGNARDVFIGFTAVLLLAPLALLHAAEPDLSTLKTFGTIGKEVKPLSADKEAELFRHEGKGCLTHMWFGGGWKGCEKTAHSRLRGRRGATVD